MNTDDARAQTSALTPHPVRRHDAALVVMTGPARILDLGTTMAGEAAVRGHIVLYLDGANVFDPYLLARLARQAGVQPKAVLKRLHLSRAFTCHQLETLVTERLPGAIARYRPALVVVSGCSHLFHDENIPAREAFRLLHTTAARLRSLAEDGQPVLATHPEEPATHRLRPLREILVHAATTVLQIREQSGRLLAIQEKPADPNGARTLPLAMDGLVHAYGPDHRPVAYPWSGR